MASTGQQPAKVVHHDKPAKHVHHGRTLAAWVGSIIAMVAFIIGGIAVVNQNDFDKALKRIDNETSDYYVLGYYSKNPDPLKRTRKIEVKVNKPDMNVWSRTSYSLKRPDGPTQK